MVTLSIITPCSRPENLPAIYLSILAMQREDVEWIIVYDKNKVDHRIRKYESFVPVILQKSERQKGKGSAQRNEALKYVTGKFIYYLDDDNLAHPRLLEKIEIYNNGRSVLIFNRFSENRKRYIKQFDMQKVRSVPGYIDTGQIVVPAIYKHIAWPDKRDYIEEFNYINALIDEIGEQNIRFIDRIYTYRNYLRRYKL